MRILHVVFDFVPGNYIGGVSKVVHELAVQQAQMGHQVTVFTPQGRPEAETAPALPTGITVQTIQSMGLKTARQCLNQLVQKHNVVHSHNTFDLLNRHVALASRDHRVPLFFHVHGALDPVIVNAYVKKAPKKHIYIRLVERRNLNLAQGVFALTSLEAKQIRSWRVSSRIHVVPNGTHSFEAPSQAEIDKFISRFPNIADKQVILYLGRIDPKKGLDVLIDAFKKISDKFPQAVLALAGNRDEVSSYTQQLDEQIQRNGLQDRIVWMGFLDETEKRNALATAQVFSHVTVSEGMPMSVLEAMAAGLPTIISPGCYMDEAVKSKAVVVASYDAQSLSQQLSNLLIHPELGEEMRENARKYIVTHHDWSVITQQINHVYEEVIARRKRRKK